MFQNHEHTLMQCVKWLSHTSTTQPNLRGNADHHQHAKIVIDTVV